MAQNGLDVERPPVKFAISDENLDFNPPAGDGDRQQDVLPKSRSTSRFKVARVDFAEEPVREYPKDSTKDSDDGNEPTASGDHPLINGEESLQGTKRRGPPRMSHPSISNDSSTSPPYSPNQGDSYNTQSYDTHNLKTFGGNTLETLPNLNHYRNAMSATGAMMGKKRPTLLELHEQDIEENGQLLHEMDNGNVTATPPSSEEVKVTVPKGTKFGWIKGVLVRCLLNIYGVMLFLRLSWIVGQTGVGLATMVILLATCVTTITALSMSAICTNGEVKGGGAYFMISRSLGPEFGGAIGLIFSVANAVAVAMYVVGFAETIRDILMDYDMLMVDPLNDVRIIGLITIVVLLAIALIGMEWEARAQLVLLAILVVAIINFIIGTFIPPSEDEKSKGFYGYKGEVVKQNFGPDFRENHNFFSVFSIFFPAATGILAGANISGDLEDASKAIPKGTLLAIVISSITYVVMAWMAGATMVRDAAGPLLPPGEYNLTNGSVSASMMLEAAIRSDALAYSDDPMWNSTDVHSEETGPVAYCSGNCSYGLLNDMQAMQLASLYGPLTIAGIISATLSSALASLVSAPKVFQAVCRDKIFPFIHVFAKGYGNSEEPRRAYLLAFAIGVAGVCIGDLNAIAPLISNFFLMSYALINYSCFDASLAKSPGWRPAFRYYSKWLSLIGALMCLVVMFIINWYMALVTFACVSALYIYVHYKKPDINWGSSTQAHVYRNALQHTLKLSHVLDHIKNYRPQILVLSGFPRDRQILVDFATNITKNISLMVCGHVVQGDPDETFKDIRAMTKAAYGWLNKRKSRAFYCVVTANNLRSGCQALLQCVGTGKLRPNTLLLGFKSNWRDAKPSDVEDYYKMINDAFDLHYGVAILRLQEGLDFSHLTKLLVSTDAPQGNTSRRASMNLDFHCTDHSMKVMDEPSSESPEDDDQLGAPLDAGEAQSDAEEVAREKDEAEDGTEMDNLCIKVAEPENINKDILNSLNQFHRKQKRGTIDVWWLFDDGGLTILLPYLLTHKSYWENCKLRVFMAGTKKMELDRDQRQMATMLSKFRIEYSSMKIIPDIGKKPHRQNIEEFQTLVQDWVLDTDKGETTTTHPWKISEEALQALKDKTNRQIRLRELLKEHSRDATLIVMTLPMPRKGLCSSGLYLAWLETLTKDMPPILLLRGNQDSVLTYYS